MISFRISIVAAALLAAAPAHAGLNPFEGSKPIAVFIEQNPWLMVVGSDTPRVAVYENGDVIFVRQSGKEYSLRIAKLSPPELAKLEETWAPLFTTQMKTDYELSDATDQTNAEFFFRHGAQQVAVSAYGLDCDGIGFAKKLTGKEAPPSALLQVHKTLCNLHFDQSEPWSPKYVEVMLWDYGYAPDKSIYWPKDWPDLKSERAIQRGKDWSIFLDAGELPKLESFVATRREKSAVEVDGKKWAIAYRFIFPSEPVWRKALLPRPDKE
jgi:hypothetical protein